MKAKIILLLFFACYTLPLFAQHPLIGAWEHQADTFQSLKIITPTHWMVIAERTTGNNNEFMRAHGGTYQLEGNHYIENIEIASWENYGKEKTEFTVSPKGDAFDQSGILMFPDGEMVAINERWHKVSPSVSIEAADPSVGTWKMLSASETNAKGKKKTLREQEVFILTPSHWMFITEDAKTKKFKRAAAGTYTKQGNKYIPQVQFASWDKSIPNNFEITIMVDGDKMTQHSVNLADNTQRISTFIREDKSQMAKTSNKNKK